MEAAVFLFDSLVMLLVLYMGLVDDRRGPNQFHTSLFRMLPGDGSPEPPRPGSRAEMLARIRRDPPGRQGRPR